MISSLLFPTRDLCYFCKEKNPFIRVFICSDCREHLEIVNKEINLSSEYINTAYYALYYNRFLRELIHSFKFNNKSYLYKPFGEIMINTINLLDIANTIDIICFVPIHRRKEAIRGYNQTKLISDYIGKKLVIPVSNNNLIKYRWTKEQNQLSRLERIKNLQNSFKIKDKQEFIDKRILLIDDLITTGSTMEECGRLLFESGAKKVIGLALTSTKK